MFKNATVQKIKVYVLLITSLWLSQGAEAMQMTPQAPNLNQSMEIVLDESIRLLNQSADVTFFYASTCPHCHQLAQKLLWLEEKGLKLQGYCAGGERFKYLKENPNAHQLMRTHKLAHIPVVIVSTKTGSRVIVQGDVPFEALISEIIAAAIEVGEEQHA